MIYPYIYDEADKSRSKRPKNRNDCAVLALAIAANMPYDSAYTILANSGRKCSRGFNFTKWADAQVGAHFAYGETYPSVKGQKRMNIANFCQHRPVGIWIVKTARHVFCVQDGVVHDTYRQSPTRCVYRAWRVR